jgi:fatty acid desaturase
VDVLIAGIEYAVLFVGVLFGSVAMFRRGRLKATPAAIAVSIAGASMPAFFPGGASWPGWLLLSLPIGVILLVGGLRAFHGAVSPSDIREH